MTAILINQLKLLPDEYRIYRGKEIINLQPKCAELLKYLADRPGEVISKETLLSVIWRDRIVGDDALTNCIRKLRRYLNDDATSPHVIETINKKGYRMIANVRLPKSRQWWIKCFLQVIVSVFIVATISFSLTHSEIEVYRYSDTDTVQQRQEKLEKMAGFIKKNPNEVSSLRITTQ